MALSRGMRVGLLGGDELVLWRLRLLSMEGDAWTVILCWKSVRATRGFTHTFRGTSVSPPTSPGRSLTGGEADAVPILQLQPGAFEFALPLLHVGFVFVELENEDVELPLQHVDLSLGQLLLPPLQQLLLGLLLQRRPRQLLFPGTKLLGRRRRFKGNERRSDRGQKP